MDGYLGEIKLWSVNFEPRGWSYCDGRLLSIANNGSLFSLLGTRFGGDGRSTFGIPDLRGRVPVCAGNGIGLSPRHLGETGGQERIHLTKDHIPEHTHLVKCDTSSTARNLSGDPTGNLSAKDDNIKIYGSDASAHSYMKSDMLDSVGADIPHENMQPFLCLNYIICVDGIYPSRQ